MAVELCELVYAWHRHGAEGSALLAEVERHVRRVSARYPEAWFELGQKDDSALTSLGHRVFARCDRAPRGPHPFLGRAPFRAYSEESLPSRPIRYHSFYAWRSVTRELLRDDYKKSVARDPVLRWRDELYRQLGPALGRVAEPAPSADGRAPRWVGRGSSPRLARAEAEALVGRALELLGRPISRSALCHLLAEVLDPPEPGPRQAEASEALDLCAAPDGLSAEDRLALRAAVAEGWEVLEPLDRALLGALARGEDSGTILSLDPRLRDAVALSRAISRVGAVFVAGVSARFGVQARPDTLPRALMDAILGVLIELLPELP
jgi:hypothetical protein